MPNAATTLLVGLAVELPAIAGLVAAWRSKLITNPILAGLLFIAYQLGVLIIAFAVKVWKQVEDEAARNAAQWVTRKAKNLTLSFRRRFHEQILREYNSFTVSGLGLIQPYRLELEHVFVDLRISPGNPKGFNFDPLSKKELSGNRPIWDFLRSGNSGILKSVAAVIIGPPGSGKTTLLKYVALRLAGGRHKRYGLPPYTPILLYLRDHVEIITQDQLSLSDLAQKYFGNSSLFANLRPPPEWFRTRLSKGRCLIMLDGLDEIADIQQRKSISKWIDTQINNYPHCPLILTSRPQGYLDAPLERADFVLEVMPFNPEQVRSFIQNWYLAVEMVGVKKQDDNARKDAAKKADDLWQRLRSTPSLSALTVNPLLLTMIAMVHRYRGKLPGSRIQLYAEICEVLLERWRQARNIQDALGLDSGKKLDVLRPLAAFMMEHKLRDIPTEQLLRIIATPLERAGLTSAKGATFIEDLQASSGLLLERETNLWGFAHLTFQEYLTAAHWARNKADPDRWDELLNDSWWHETLRLYAAQSDATGLVEECLAINTITSLALAADFLEEGREIDPNVRCLAEEVVIGGLKSEDEARRSLAAEVKLSRRLKSLNSIDGHREIDPEYVTRAEYQLFLRDTHRQKARAHGSELRQASLSGRDWSLEPVTGINAENAENFCRWLIDRFGGLKRYRLPSLDEASEFPSTNSEIAAWCKDNHQYALVGLTRERELKILSDLQEFLISRTELSIPAPTSLPLSPSSTPDRALRILHELLRGLQRTVSITDRLIVTHSTISDYPADVKAVGPLIEEFLNEDIYNSIRFMRDLAIEATLGLIFFGSDSNHDGDFTYHDLILKLRNHADAPTLTYDLARIRKIHQYRELDLVMAADLIFDVNVDLKRAIGITQEIIAAAINQNSNTLIGCLPLEVASILTVDIVLIAIIEKFNLHNVVAVMRLAKTLTDWANPDRLIPFFHAASGNKRGETVRNLQLVEREYTLLALPFIYSANKELKTEAIGTPWGRWLKLGKNYLEHQSCEITLPSLYWWNHIIIAREDGVLSAWEGIRIVREEITHVKGNL